MKLFEALKGTGTGELLAEYLVELQNKFCDARNFKEGENVESVKRLAALIQTELIDKIKNQTVKKDLQPLDINEYD